MKPALFPPGAGWPALLAALIGLGAGLTPVAAQEYRSLIHFTNTWRYEESGTDLGSAWRTNDYDDSAWPAGRGLFYAETTLYPQPFITRLNLTSPAGPQVITYYFRTEFEFTGNPTGMVLLASNLVDDGCVIHLNGVEAGRVRVAPGQNHLTFANGPPRVEGQSDVTNLVPAALRSGTNLLAVEVHQFSPTSADVVWGMALTALVPQALVITDPPRALSVPAGERAVLSVGVSGGPVRYQWRQNGAPVANATNATLVLSFLNASHAGDYTVVASNAVSVVESSPATLTVLPDTLGPRIISADAGNTNIISLTFSEPLLGRSTTNRENYSIRRLDTGAFVIISNVQLAFGTNFSLRVGGPDWIPDRDYLVTVNNVRDTSPRANVIAPNSQYIIHRRSVPLVEFGEVWSFHSAASFDPGVYAEPWTTVTYTEGPWWARGRTALFSGSPALLSCLNGTPQTQASFQPEPLLFRKLFIWPEGLTTNVVLGLGYWVQEGVIVFLNGIEIYRRNAPAPPVTFASRALNTSSAICAPMREIPLSLRRGTNCLAAALLQYPEVGGILIFDLRLEAARLKGEAPPSSGNPPVLRLDRLDADAGTLAWDEPGFALEESADAGGGTGPLPWLEVPAMSNPYPISLTNQDARFFRLRKP